ncbi:DUF1573 domain-containing protein [Candidatus Acetothermia bacterium]|nr:DUF1573 domain-containing protein [Candidatus Acetothermia bacterium]
MNHKALWIVGVVVVAALIGGGLLFSQLSRSNGNSAQASNAQATGGTPSLQIEATDLDLGTLSVSEERAKEIKLTNSGTGPLQISKVNTSCMCTFAQLVIDGKESPEFNMTMHMSAQEINWVSTLQPKQSATLRAIYRPKLMPVKGRVDREIQFNTNDPTHPQVKVYLKAIVQN